MMEGMKHPRTNRSEVLVGVIVTVAISGAVAADAYGGLTGTTDHCGQICADETWYAADNPHIVTCSIEICCGATLTIQQGVEVRFEPGRDLEIKVGSPDCGAGTLVARGTEASKILFTSNASELAPGDWLRIYFTEQAVDAAFDVDNTYLSGSILEYAVVEHAGAAAGDGAVKIVSSSPYLNHTEIRHSADRCIRIDGALGRPQRIEHCEIWDCKAGSGYGGGIYLAGGFGHLLSDNHIHSCLAGDGGGIYLNAQTSFQRNTVGGVVGEGNTATYKGGGVYLGGASDNSLLDLNTIAHNTASYDDGGGIYFNWSGGCTLDSNAINNNIAERDDGGGIYFNYSDGCTLDSNTINNNVASAGSGGGVYFYSSHAGDLRSNTIAQNSALGYGGGLYLSGGDGTLTSNYIAENRVVQKGGAIVFSGGPWTLADNGVTGNCTYAGQTGGILTYSDLVFAACNRIHDNRCGNQCENQCCDLRNESGADTTITAECQWWGSCDINQIEPEICDCSDDPALGCVDYEPLAGPDCTTCPCPRCGDGKIDPGEECDDGNTLNGDGCSSTCMVEGGWECIGEPSVCTEKCGDGLIVGSESCDDGYTDTCGTCNADCTGAGTGSACGDGIVCRETEACDDGYTDACGSCNVNCTGPGIGSTCGDGVICPETEACDDGGASDTDGCSSTCTVESGWWCIGEPSVCTEVCGDGLIVGTEECDDGNTDNCDGCDSECIVEKCGNDKTQCNEECDGTDDLACPDRCRVNCTCEGVCGDGNIDPGEECDDGNIDNCDGCDSECIIERCGNGKAQCNEACDDGMNDTADCDGPGAGDNACTLAECGDSYANGAAGEECDGTDDSACPDQCLANCICETEILVRVVPVILRDPTATPGDTYPGPDPPPSYSCGYGGADFYVEIWVSNVAGEQPGLACVTEDVHYTSAALHAVPPVQDGPLFPINPVEPIFDDAADVVEDVSGCQAAPPIDHLGVNEWVMVDRIEMTCIEPEDGRVDLTYADNVFAGVSLIGEAENLDPSEVRFESQLVECGCGDCSFDVNCNGVIDTGDYAFFLSCFATLVQPGDPCYCLDVNGNGGIDTGDYAAFLGCFATYCPCPTTGGLTSSASADIQLVTRQTPNVSDATDQLPKSLSRIKRGEPLYVEVWASARGGADDELACVFTDLEFEPAKLSVLNVQTSDRFSELRAWEPDSAEGRLLNLGGCIAPSDRGLGHKWERIAVVELSRSESNGVTAIQAKSSRSPFHGTSVVGFEQRVDAPGSLLDRAEMRFMPPPIETKKNRQYPNNRW